MEVPNCPNCNEKLEKLMSVTIFLGRKILKTVDDKEGLHYLGGENDNILDEDDILIVCLNCGYEFDKEEFEKRYNCIIE